MSALAGLFTSLLLASAVSGGDLVESEGPKRKAPLSYVCAHCQQGFPTSTGLANHYRARPEHQPEVTQTRKRQKRHNYTYHDKLEIIAAVEDARKRGVRGAAKTIAGQYGVKPSTLRNWSTRKSKADIAEMCAASKGAKRRLRVFYGQHEECDQQTYLEFCRRRDLGRRVGGKWLRKVYKKRCAEQGFSVKAGRGWLRGFLKRWRISQQCRTNKKCTPVAERRSWIQAFHVAWIYGIQWTGLTRCPKYGRFPADRIFHMDQVPIQFSGSNKRTYSSIGDRSGCRLGDPSGSDAGKRFATLQVTIRAEGDQVCNLEIYFKSLKPTESIDQEELDHYASIPGVRVRFQKKAWADEGVILDYLQDFREDTKDLGEVLLGMDRHGSQKTPLVREFMNYMEIFPLYTPPECTDVISPCDHHTGHHLQSLIAAKYELAYDDNQSAWDSDGINTAAKRMMFATWASDAWTDLCTKNKHLITQAFVETGFLLARDGSENHLIRLQHWNSEHPYEF